MQCAVADLDEWEDVQVKHPPADTAYDDSGVQVAKTAADEDEWEDV